VEAEAARAGRQCSSVHSQLVERSGVERSGSCMIVSKQDVAPVVVVVVVVVAEGLSESRRREGEGRAAVERTIAAARPARAEGWGD
jgi:hypothetical protein